MLAVALIVVFAQGETPGAADVRDWADVITTAAIVVILALALHRRWIVMGWTYDRTEIDRDRWRDLALELLEAGKVSTSTASRAVELARGKP